MIGAVIMKITMSSIITSISETTLISALSGVRSLRPRRRISDPSLASHERDHLGAKAIELTVKAVELRCKNVIPEHRGNGDSQRRGRRDERLGHAGRNGAKVARAALGDAEKRGDHAEHRAEQPHERTGRSNDGKPGDRAAELVALRVGFCVEHEAQRLDLRCVELGARVATVRAERTRIMEERDRPLEHAGVWTRAHTLGDRDGLLEARNLLELLEEGPAPLVYAAELEPLRQHDPPADEREEREERKDALRHVRRTPDQFDRRARDGAAELQRRHYALNGMRFGTKTARELAGLPEPVVRLREAGLERDLRFPCQQAGRL